MANEADAVIYLEADEEITSVIDKLKRSKSPIVGIVAPRNAVLLQSVVNLKLLKKEAEKNKKNVALVTADTVGQNLALRTGLTVYKNIHDSEPIAPPEVTKPKDTIVMDESDEVDGAKNMTGGFKVHHYRDEDEEAEKIIPARNQPTVPLAASEDMREKTLGQLQEEPMEDAAVEPPDEKVPDTVTTPSKIDRPDFERRPIDDKESQIIYNDEHEQKVDFRNTEDINHKNSDADESITRKTERSWPPPSRNIPTTAGSFRTKWWHQKNIITIIFIIAIMTGGGIFAATRSMPQVKVGLTIEATPLNKTFAAKVSKNQTAVDADNSTIPGKLLLSTQQDTKTFQATGKKDVGVRATGSITVYNETGLDNSFESGTAFVAKDSGFIFRADSAFTVPKASLNAAGDKVNGSVEIDVTADSPGAQYNIAATSYSISDYEKIYGSGTNMSGGSTREITVVSKADIRDNAKRMANDLYAQGLTDLKKQAGADTLNERLIVNQISETKPSATAGTEVAQFDLKITTKSSVLVYSNSNIDRLAELQLIEDLPEGSTLLPNSIQAKATDGKLDIGSGTMKLSIAATGYYGTNVDESTIKSTLYNKNILEAEATLKSLNNITAVTINFSPAWWRKKIPKDANKIDLEIHYVQKGAGSTETNVNSNTNANANLNSNDNNNTNSNQNTSNTNSQD